MKIERLETHDRLLHLQQDQSETLSQGALDCVQRNPLSLALQARAPYIYVFAHPRTHDDGVNKRMLWQPRLGKPKPQTNSYLWRVKSHTTDFELCWMIPPRELWEQYKEGNITQSELVTWSIDQFVNNREKLAEPFPEDFSQAQIRQILKDIAQEMDEERRIKKMYVNTHKGLIINGVDF